MGHGHERIKQICTDLLDFLVTYKAKISNLFLSVVPVQIRVPYFSLTTFARFGSKLRFKCPTKPPQRKI